MTDAGYAPGADTPGARVARQQPSAAEQRRNAATERMRGGRTAATPYTRPAISDEHLDRATIKHTAANELEHAESRAEHERHQQQLADEQKTLTAALEAEATTWLEQGLANGWFDPVSEQVSADADPAWIAEGQELADYAEEAGYE